MKIVPRTFAIGSEWIYFKLYTGPKTADLLLTELIKPVSENLLDSGLITKWFFIRYEDPKFHLRIRFKTPDISKIGQTLIAFNENAEVFLRNGLIWRIQLDTYQREMERYGKETIQNSESIFFHDSEMVMQLLDLIDDSEEGEELRWIFSMLAIDTFLNDFNLSESEKCHLLESLKTSFCTEFHMNKFLKKQLDTKYINNSSKISEFMKRMEDDNEELTILMKLTKRKSDKTKSSINSILQTVKKEDLFSLLGSHIHMLMNRLHRSKNRLHEMVIYYFLFKFYKEEIGRKKHHKVDLSI